MVRFLADHCVYRHTVDLLREAGFDVAMLKDVGPPDAPDSHVWSLAQQRERVLLSTDLDFANVLLYPPQESLGVIVLRITSENENAVHDNC